MTGLAGWLDIAWLRFDLLVRLLLAALLGGAIGLEREISGKPAGFRTNLLICVGAALLTDLSVAISHAADPRMTNADPARIAAQIVSGIGFLGAGTILQARGSVIGLTTAATLWVVAAIGIAVGASAYVEAIGTTALVLIALLLLGQIEERVIRQRAPIRVRVTTALAVSALDRVWSVITDLDAEAELAGVERGPETLSATYFVHGSGKLFERVVSRLLEIDEVREVGR